ncbi:hypothetical protein DRH27_04530 [Candidatus Falkowbacteria bacterium]|nr:MAG: hypothetical protein DRH27_04530 [Candidatus Falkowbacteria bacterium]
MTKGNLEKVLYSKLKDKDKEAFIRAYDLYLDHIYRFIFFKVNQKEEAEDLTSHVFLKTWDYIQNNKLNDYKTLKSLLYKVARNVVIDHYRKTSQQANIHLDSPETIGAIDERQDIKSQLELTSDLESVMKKLMELKAEYREVIMLKYVNELTVAEIADILEKSRGNTRVLIFRALKALKAISNN